MDAANDRSRASTAAERVSEELQRARDNIVRAADSAGADLAAELERLQGDIADIKRTLAGFAEASGAEARGAASRLGGVASEKIDEFAERARSESETIVGELEAYARKNPYQVLAGALGIGVIIGLLMRRR